jgi:hypothetical protein
MFNRFIRSYGTDEFISPSSTSAVSVGVSDSFLFPFSDLFCCSADMQSFYWFLLVLILLQFHPTRSRHLHQVLKCDPGWEVGEGEMLGCLQQMLDDYYHFGLVQLQSLAGQGLCSWEHLCHHHLYLMFVG